MILPELNFDQFALTDKQIESICAALGVATENINNDVNRDWKAPSFNFKPSVNPFKHKYIYKNGKLIPK